MAELKIVTLRMTTGWSEPNRNALKTYVQESNIASKRYGSAFVKLVLERFEQVLAPGGRLRIGASGRSSSNFVISDNTTKDKKGYLLWEVSEGANGANEIIRSGIAPGRRPSFSALRTWVARKKIRMIPDINRKRKSPTVHNAHDIKLTQRTTKDKEGNVTKVTPYGRAQSGQGKRANRAIGAIQAALFHSGTERETANWFDKMPKGQGRFDYIRYTFSTNKTYFERNQPINDIAQVYVKNISSTRTHKNVYRVFGA